MGLGTTFLALSSVLGFTSIANAATFNFSFTNEGGNINGTVEGTVELPDGDGTFAATSVIVTSAPPEVFPVGNPDFTTGMVLDNSFEVIDGEINLVSLNLAAFVDDALNNEHYIQFSSGSGGLVNSFTGDGMNSRGNTSLTFTPANGVGTPEPTSLVALIGVGVLSVSSKLKKKA